VHFIDGSHGKVVLMGMHTLVQYPIDEIWTLAFDLILLFECFLKQSKTKL
jgi:hypothetical protein